ncbi:acetoacetate decarboxylase [Microbispora sp. H10830]|uniref:acetoacetate decarboxylase n=1 Tax=Microbispora sp. H10830 TaxID=2729109 RepID=UPI0028731169|nr:acetoacetate decarboxylase [Microbispora sp. H10830]
MSGGVGGRRARCDPLTAFSTPVNAPAYASPPYKFTDREYFRIVYRTDLEAVRGVVPEPLTVVDPVVRFEVIRMPDSTGFGSYHECGQIAIVEHDGRQVDFNIGLYVDSVSAIVSGRELGGYPKTGGTPRLYVDSDTLVATLDYGTLRVAIGTMGFKHHERDGNEAIEELCLPVYQLKVARGNGGALRACELVQTSMTDLVVKGAWTAPGRLQLFEHALAPLADLPVREVISATHTLTDLTLGEAQTVHDYLEK